MSYIQPERQAEYRKHLEAVKLNGLALENVPIELRTMEMCWEAIATDGLALQFVPEAKGLREQLFPHALRQTPLSLGYTADQNFDRCMAAAMSTRHKEQILPLIRDEAMRARVQQTLQDQQQMLNLIEATVARFGWTAAPNDVRRALLSGANFVKDYETSVGVKTASILINILPGGDVSPRRFFVQGCYDSAGGNVLGSLDFSIPLVFDDSEVTRMLEVFCISAQESIDDSYARRLYLRSVETAPLAPSM